MNFVALIGRLFLGFLGTLGRIAMFAGTAISHCVMPPFYVGIIGRQMMSIGYFSLPIVGMTALFTGMVLALQIYVGSSRFDAEGAVATMWTEGRHR